MSELSDMLAHCESRGGLNLSDISRWLETSIPTIREWRYHNRIPRGYKHKFVLERMALLVNIIDALPPDSALIPPTCKQVNRASFIENLKNEHIRVLREGAA